jgi:iron(III) transport system permease protein
MGSTIDNGAAQPDKTGVATLRRPLHVSIILLALAAMVALPFVAAIAAAFAGTLATGLTLAGSLLGPAALNTILLSVIVGVVTGVIGTGTAWLVSTHRFAFSRVLEVALALPLAFPAYVVAYAYAVFLDHPGPVQSALRAMTGWQGRDYWFPDIRSLGGAAFVLAMVLYPYVYLLARAAFLNRSGAAFQVARTLGAGPWRAFITVAAPMARPAVGAGIALVMMETVADFGTVAHFGVQTFATAIYQSWFAMGDRAAAAQLSLVLLFVVLLLLTLERNQRGRARRVVQSRRDGRAAMTRLEGWRGAAAFLACLLPVVFGFIVPLAMLASLVPQSDQSLFSARYLGFIINSVTLASIAAIITMAAALFLGLARRLVPGPLPERVWRHAGAGYAVPGTVIAVGLLVPFAAFDNALDAFMRANFGISTGLLITGSIGLLVLAYCIRFLSPAMGAVESGLDAIRPSLDGAARTLGSRVPVVMLRIHLPLLATGAFTGALIVFVDVMKELPATLIMRPFNFDTLAVQAYRLASDERLADAALPSLVIVGFGLLPVLILCRALARGGDAAA